MADAGAKRMSLHCWQTVFVSDLVARHSTQHISMINTCKFIDFLECEVEVLRANGVKGGHRVWTSTTLAATTTY